MAEKVAVIGTGYVGLVSGACLAAIGHKVICVDKDDAKVARLKHGDIPIYEPGLSDMVRSGLEQERLAFTSDIGSAVSSSDIVFVAVGTPPLDNGDVDMTQVRTVFEQIAEHMAGYKCIVIKSTVPVGTHASAAAWLKEKMAEPIEFDIVSVPEFLREGSAIHDTFHMDRLVIGSASRAAAERIAELHKPFGAPVLHTDNSSAELIKYASNAFLAAKISFINEMAHVCEKVGADIQLVAKGMGMDRRIGPHFLNAGIGYGGSCFPKDTRAQLRIAEAVDYDFKILRSVIEVNQLQRQRFVEKVASALNGSLEGKKLAVMGLAFKPNTDDLRDAPALDIIEMLQSRGAAVRAYDPVAVGHARPLLPETILTTDPYEAITGADAMIITTEWDTVRALELTRVKQLLASPIIIDGRNVFAPSDMATLGFRYVSVGREER
ncbi:UDP-glucose dehydrogenase family protein [Paenibacillus chartarius]|uniref:UDP-glucose 6-dehydrogenase n=1 Tax=Paenibacillus chartarius TaxID=747481 RepID=A0ABV6DTS5_9BACL